MRTSTLAATYFFDLAEHVTRLADQPDPVPDAVWDAAAEHYDQEELASLAWWVDHKIRVSVDGRSSARSGRHRWKRRDGAMSAEALADIRVPTLGAWASLDSSRHGSGWLRLPQWHQPVGAGWARNQGGHPTKEQRDHRLPTQAQLTADRQSST